MVISISEPPSPRSRSPPLHRLSQPPPPPPNMGYFSMPFERFRKDELGWTTGFTLLDTIETYFDSRIDLLERHLKKQGDKLKIRAEEALKRTKTPIGEFRYSVDLEKELQKFKLKVSSRMTNLAVTWQSTKVVRTREKISFFLGVNAVAFSALMFGIAPEWVHVAYTIGALSLIPIRWYTYKQKAWHYFLFDLCYYANIICLIYIWILPSSTTLLIASYCLAHGSLASAVITWRNSLVFHDADKVTSLFIHLYPPFTFTIIRHFYPNSYERFPALIELPHLNAARALLISGVIYIVWQTLYWKFVLIDRRQKIQSGLRTTSFSWLLNDKHGAIGRALSSVKPVYREPSFMAGQLGKCIPPKVFPGIEIYVYLVYAMITELPAIYLLYDSPFWSAVFLWIIFAVSIWNGGGFYIEVFGRKFERELEALRKELAEATASSRPGTSISMHSAPAGQSANTYSGRTSPTHSEDFYVTGSAAPSQNGSPMVHGIDLYTDESPQPMSLAIDEETDVPTGINNDDKKQV